MLVNLTGGPFDGQQKNVQQKSDKSIMGNLLPMPETLTWSGGRKYAKQTEGGKYTAAEYTYCG